MLTDLHPVSDLSKLQLALIVADINLLSGIKKMKRLRRYKTLRPIHIAFFRIIFRECCMSAFGTFQPNRRLQFTSAAEGSADENRNHFQFMLVG